MHRTIAKRLAIFAASLMFANGALAAASHPSFKVEVSGKGQPMIMIPGLASDGSVWNGTVGHFCAQHQCHVLTLAGFAGQPAIEGPLLSTVEQQLSDYIADNKLAHPVVIGHSMGGFLGMKLASDHPEQVDRLIIVDTLPALGARQQPDISAAQLKEMANAMRDDMLAQTQEQAAVNRTQFISTMVSNPEDLKRVVGWSERSDRKTVANSMAEMMGEDLRQQIAHIKAPTLVLGSWVAYKAYAPKAMFEGLYQSQFQKLPGVTIELSDDARHFIMYDNPDWMYARIDNFLK